MDTTKLPTPRQIHIADPNLRQSGMTWDEVAQTHANLGWVRVGGGVENWMIDDIARDRVIGKGKLATDEHGSH